MLNSSEIITAYGKPGDLSNITIFKSPYPLRVAWDMAHTVSSFQCHVLAAPKLLEVFNGLLAHYGFDQLKSLGIDLYGGCLNVRPKRGLETRYANALKAGDTQKAYECLSRHAWGIAIDLDPARNALKVKKPDAQFSHPEYQPMIDIFYKSGFLSYGVEKDFDWMHFELAK